MTKTLSSISTRQELHTLLAKNDSMVIIKFGAEWCEPCRRIESLVDKCMSEMPTNVTCMKLDIDECIDIYAYLRSKKVVKSIPAIIAYKSGNTHFAPDDMVNTSNEQQVREFFERCKAEL
jgi:thioredoxin-like negative regulator of GroEL